MAITKDDVKKIWDEVAANRLRLNRCKLHQFQGMPELGKDMTCVNCGGRLQLGHVGMYIDGYEAAGGRADMIWPAYRAMRRSKH